MPNLRFDVEAHGEASELVTMAAQARALDEQLKKLDGRKIKLSVALDNRTSEELQRVSSDVRGLDGKTAKVAIKLDAASSAPIISLERELSGIDGRTAHAKVEVDVDKSATDRITGLSSAVSKFSQVADSATGGISRFRSVAKGIVDPASLPVIERVSDAIANKFHSAVDVARVGVDKLQTGLGALKNGLVGLGVAGNVVSGIASIGGAIAQLSGVAALAPAALLGMGAAFATAKLATVGFSDALTGSAAAQKDAFDAMGPQAQKLVTTFKSLGPAANQFRQAIQDTAVKGLSDQVKSLAGTYLPLLKAGLSDIATGMNGMAISAAKAVQSSSAIANVRVIVGQTANAFANMRGAVGNVVLGLLDLGAAGAKYLPDIGTGIDNAARSFRTWASTVTSNGQFQAWVKSALEGFKQLGTILGNIGTIATTVFTALNQNGAGLLTTLVGVTTQLKTFLQSAQGTAALQSLAATMAAAGDAMSHVFGAALQALAPILVTIAPLLQELATQIGDHLVSAINLAAPILQRLAEAAAANPEIFLALAKAAELVAVGFGPAVAIIGVAATLLKGLLLARLVGLAMAEMGLAGSAVSRVLLALVSPMALIREAMPLIARGVGTLVASLVTATGPIGALIVGFATLYASSSQFRAAVDGVGSTIAGLFTRALQQAGEVLNSTVRLLGLVGSAIGEALSGLTNFGSKLASAFGPAGQAVSAALTGIFNVLGNLPGAALAAYAAFVVLGKIAPLFTVASAAVAGFSARMLAFQGSSGAATVAANGVGVATGKLGTALSKAGSYAAIAGVAIVALGAVYDAFGSKSDELAGKVLSGSITVQQAMDAETAQVEKNQLWWDSDAQKQEAYAAARKRVTDAINDQRAAMSPMEQLQSDVAVAQTALNDAVAQFGKDSPQATIAAANFVAAQQKLKAAQDGVADSTKTATERLKEQADQMQSQIDTALAYASAVQRTAEAQKAANDALTESGPKSDEYKSKVLDLAQAVSSQADAARRQAEALGDSEAGVKAYNTEILKAADISTQAGRDAFAQVASGMDSAGLAALSATAKMSGLRTEIVTLPDGRTVTVVVAADRAQLDSVQKSVNEIASKKYVGTVTLRGDPKPLGDVFKQQVALIDGSTGTMTLNANGAPVAVQVGQSKYLIDTTTGRMQIQGNPGPGEADLSGLVLLVDQATGVMTLGANPALANGVLAAWQAFANGSSGIPQLDSNPTLANQVLQLWKATSDATTGLPQIDAKSGKAEGVLAVWKNLADGTTGIPALDSNPELAKQVLAVWKSQSDATTGLPKLQAVPDVAAAEAALNNAARDRTSTIHVVTETSSVNSSGVDRDISNIPTGAGGGLVGYAGGGLVPLHRFARGGVIPGYAPGRDTVPAVLSKGEAVLVPELVKQIGPRNIIAANWAASHRKATYWSGGGVARYAAGGLTTQFGNQTTGSSASVLLGSIGAPSVPAGTPDVAGLRQLAAATKDNATELQAVRELLATQPRSITVEDHSGNPVETARATQLAFRMSRQG